jgi:hypothetical protein
MPEEEFYTCIECGMEHRIDEFPPYYEGDDPICPVCRTRINPEEI